MKLLEEFKEIVRGGDVEDYLSMLIGLPLLILILIGWVVFLA
jgi:hypothetical protein